MVMMMNNEEDKNIYNENDSIEKKTYIENELLRFIGQRIDYLVDNCAAKFKFIGKKWEEKKRKLINHVWDRWTDYDLNELKKKPERSKLDYSDLSIFENEIDKIVIAKQKKLKPESKEILNELDQTRLPQKLTVITGTNKQMTKKEIFEKLENMSGIMEKLPKKMQRTNLIWKLTEGEVWRQFSNKFPNKAGKKTLIRYLKEFRSEKTN